MLFRMGLHNLLILCVLGAVWGEIWASVLEYAASKIPRDLPLARRTCCSSCGHKLSLLDLVPIFSWILLRGRCRYCATQIPVYYVLSEVGFVIVTILCLLQYGVTIIMVRNWIFLCCLFCIALVEWEGGKIPSVFIGIGLVIWVGTLPFAGLSVRDVIISFLKCILLFAFSDGIFSFLINQFDFGPFKGYGYHTDCAALFSLTALYLRLFPVLLAVGLACFLLFLLRAKIKPTTEKPSGCMGAMMAVSSAIILIIKV